MFVFVDCDALAQASDFFIESKAIGLQLNNCNLFSVLSPPPAVLRNVTFSPHYWVRHIDLTVRHAQDAELKGMFYSRHLD